MGFCSERSTASADGEAVRPSKFAIVTARKPVVLEDRCHGCETTGRLPLAWTRMILALDPVEPTAAE
jgi:hypothetical protein